MKFTTAFRWLTHSRRSREMAPEELEVKGVSLKIPVVLLEDYLWAHTYLASPTC